MQLLRNILLFILFYFNLTHSYKICALKEHSMDCKGLERYNNIKCVYVDNELSCLTKIDSGEIDFGLINAETLFLGTHLTSNVVAIAQTKPETNVHYYQYETVIVSRERFKPQKGMSYCHPGFKPTNIPPLILKEFEQQVIGTDYDTKFETSIESEISALNNYFGPSCRPGEWTLNKPLDEYLHNKYTKLTELCDELKAPSFEQALECMLKNNHSIALSSLNTVNGMGNTITTPLWYYCKNGTVSKEPCVWSKQPHKLLIVNTKENDLKNSLEKWLTANRDLADKELEYLKEILEDNENSNVQLKYRFNKDELLQTWTNFSKSFRYIPPSYDSIISRRKMRWCTTSDNEQMKCKWLSQAGVNYGIQPVVECVQKSSEFECLKAINKNSKTADLMVISTDLGYAARKYGLSAIAFPVTNQAINTLLLIKNNRNITRLEDLKGKRGCFPLYGGTAWLSFVKVLKGIDLRNESSDYGKLLSDLLGDSCMPGAMETNRAFDDKIDLKKMCKLCTETGNTCGASEATNLYFNTSGALKCLEEKGDFAVIVKDPTIKFPTNVSVMCKNGTFSMLDSFDVDEGCYLSTVISSEIITRNNDPLNNDSQLAFLEFEYWFSNYPHKPFGLFDSFNNINDLLFKDTTKGLELPSSEKDIIKNYVKLLDHINHYENGHNKAFCVDNSSITFFTTIVIIVTIFLNSF
nr:transferrin-like isoform X1 [Onthophagus taurus]XP_022909239.1 transferrin-like isoform X1 [Onthophagus taurus]